MQRKRDLDDHLNDASVPQDTADKMTLAALKRQAAAAQRRVASHVKLIVLTKEFNVAMELVKSANAKAELAKEKCESLMNGIEDYATELAYWRETVHELGCKLSQAEAKSVEVEAVKAEIKLLSNTS